MLEAPEVNRSPESRLHLIGDVERAVLFAQRLDLGEVARRRHGETVGRGYGLHDDRGHVVARKGALHGVDVVEGDVRELIGAAAVEHLQEAVVASCDRQAGMPVIGLDDGDNFLAPRSEACALDGDVDRLASAGAEHHLVHGVSRDGFNEGFGQGGAP